MFVLRSDKEIEKIAVSAGMVAKVLSALEKDIKPGVNLMDLDRKAEEMTREMGAKPAFKGYKGFPGCVCISVNDEIVHGIPRDKKLIEGDIVGLDFGVQFDGYYGDSALTVAVGQVSEEAKRLMKVTQESLYKGIEQARPGNRLHDISAAIQEHAEKHDYSIVREFVGHGIGRNLHEDPQIPNYGEAGTGMRLKAGMVIAIEPMVNAKKPGMKILDDGWTAVTEDGELSAHFEHTLAILESGPRILSKRN